MIVSDAKAAANRANAQRSTGPRTPQGKANVRRNAHRHGLYAETAPDAGEDALAFGQLYDDFLRRFCSSMIVIAVSRTGNGGQRAAKCHQR